MIKFQRQEVVRVDCPGFIVSSSHKACRYETSDGEPLAPGYYLALWRSSDASAFYDDQIRYIGPFSNHTEAQLLRASAVALKIVALNIDKPVTSIPVESNHRDWLLSHSGLVQAEG
ncbi:MAG: hypothetical protein NT159_05350 [Proteobacteria bacterium]|nr:hypothetical protein [Pseudomonadota bacterium]